MILYNEDFLHYNNSHESESSKDRMCISLIRRCHLLQIFCSIITHSILGVLMITDVFLSFSVIIYCRFSAVATISKNVKINLEGQN